MGTFIFTLAIAVAILGFLAAFALLFVRWRKRTRHIAHIHHQPWWLGLRNAEKLVRQRPLQVGTSYFWENDETRMRLQHDGKSGYEGTLTIVQKHHELGAEETLVYTHDKNRGWTGGAGHIFGIAALSEGIEPYPLQWHLWPLYFAATRKALVT